MFISDLLEAFDDLCVYYENQYIKIFRIKNSFCIFQKEAKKFLRGARDIEEIKNKYLYEYIYSEYNTKKIYDIGKFKWIGDVETMGTTHNFIVHEDSLGYQLVSDRGEFLLPKYVKDIYCDSFGFRVVKDRENRTNAIDRLGNFVFQPNNSFRYISNLDSRGLFIVKTCRGFNLANTNGRFVLDTFYDNLAWQCNGFIGHKYSKGMIAIDDKGQIISNVWHSRLSDAVMELDGLIQY
jgi:hypothetical protein